MTGCRRTGIVIHDVSWECGSVIGNFYDDRFVLGVCGDVYPRTDSRRFHSGMGAVQQVEDRLLKMDFVGANRGKVGSEMGFDLDGVVSVFRFHFFEDVSDERVELDGTDFTPALDFIKIPELMDDVGDFFSCTMNQLQFSA